MEINVIYTIDCRTGIKTLPDNSVDCCVTIAEAAELNHQWEKEKYEYLKIIFG